MLQRERETARLRVNTQPRRFAVPVRQRDVEHLHVDLADVATLPLLEDVDQEPPVPIGGHRPIGDEVAVLHVEGTILHRLAPALVGDRQHLGGGALDDRDELHEPGAAVVPKEPVDLSSSVVVGRVDRGEGVPLDAVALQHAESLHHPVEAALPALVDPERVVHLTRSVDREPHEEAVLGEERTPLVVEQRAVRLDRVGDALVRQLQLLGELDRASEEVDPHHRRLAALPRDRDLGRTGVRLDQLAEVRLEQFVRHAEPAARVQHLLGQEEAVRAVQVADRPGGLGEQMERRRCAFGEERRSGSAIGQDHGVTLPAGRSAGRSDE